MKTDYTGQAGRGGEVAVEAPRASIIRGFLARQFGYDTIIDSDPVMDLLRANQDRCADLATRKALEGFSEDVMVQVEDGAALAARVGRLVEGEPREFLVVVQNPLITHTTADGKIVATYTGIIPFGTGNNDQRLATISFCSLYGQDLDPVNWGFVPGRDISESIATDRPLAPTLISRADGGIALDYFGSSDTDLGLLDGSEGYIPAHTYIFDIEEVSEEQLKAVFDGDVTW